MFSDNPENLNVAPCGHRAAGGKASDDVAVVIPNYNHGAFLEQTILAFVNQTLQPREIIIVDDCSTDDSWQIISRLANVHGTIRPVRRYKNGGVNVAICDGLNRAMSTFVSMSAADDVFLPRFLERSANLLARHSDAALCFSDSGVIGPDGRSFVPHPKQFGLEEAFFSANEFAEMLRRQSFTISSNTVVYRREWLIAAGGFCPELKWHADWFANMRLALTHGVCYVPETMSYFRMTPGSYSQVSMKKRTGRNEVIRRCLEIAYASEDDEFKMRFRRSAIMPEHNIIQLVALSRHPAFREHISLWLIMLTSARHLWRYLRPIMPMSLRRWLRKRLDGF